ncbi:hypothetical protein [Myxacorys almedinensis]|uniref:Uncharacterized protein n=1 Tax=Myxacorys almedinensis A TaxID=2690445 RepID=A0A8J7Z2L3_9CYAN|nr:hypothetical protein [Myxacorys almedinensis]NDJ18869.1 hypothetical protein [Myxacorys almedinensis A]
MNNTIASLLLIVLLCTLIFSPFAALSLLMLFVFAAAMISLVSAITRAVLTPTSDAAQRDRE